MNKSFCKTLTIILVVVFILSTMPQTAFAVMAKPLVTQAQEPALSSGSTNLTPQLNNVSPLPTVVAEDISKRTEFSKEFVLSDGSRQMMLYPQPVHYMKDSKWQDIDDTLIQGKDSAGNSVLENTADSVSIQLPTDFAPGKPVSMVKDGYTLQFTLEGNYAGSASAVQPQNANLLAGMTDNEKKTIPIKLDSTVTYSSVLPNIDIKYDVEPEQLKESVIVNSLPATPLTYTYNVMAKNLTPVLQKDNSINFYPQEKTSGDPVFVMPAPTMVDSKGVVDYDVNLTLDTTGGNCKITYAPSMDWLSATGRAWPVVIDPVINANLDINNIRDQQVDSNNNNVSYTSSYIEAGRHTTYGKERIFLMYQNLPALTSADVITNATIEIYRPYDSTTVTPMEVHKVNSTWDDTNLQWSNMPGFDSSVDDYLNVQNHGWYTWTITDIARGWYAGTNTGMMFKMPDSIENGTSSNNKTFYSSDNGTGYRPILAITFRNSCGIENYWNYHTQDIGRAGTGYINDYTGNLVMEHNDIGIDGNIMPVSIQHVYNADDKSDNTFGCGYGWRTNYNQRVYQWSVDSSYYVWEDEDATLHYFKLSTGSTYLDEDGLNLTMVTNLTGSYKYSITDTTGNVKYFDSYGRLVRIQNNQSTASHIDITYTTGSGYLINTITDGVSRVYQFVYTGSNLTGINYKGTGSTTLQSIGFAYNANTELSTITYNDSKTTTYGYSSNHLLNQATDIDGYYVSYGYNTTSASLPDRVTSVAYYDNSTAGDTLAISYYHNETKFTDYQGRTTIEQFNDSGNTTCVQDSQGDAQYANYSSSTANQLTLSSKLENTVTNLLINGNAEGTDGWAQTLVGGSTGTWAVNSSDQKYIGNYSIKIAKTNSSGSSLVQQTVSLVKGHTYTLSAYVYVSSITGGGNGAQLCIENSGATQAYSNKITAATSGWQRLEVTYTVPTSASSSSVTFDLSMSSQGTAYFDAIQAEEAPSASRYNLIENGDFAYQGSSSTTADYWSSSGLSSSDIRTTASPSGCPRLDTNCFTIYGSNTASKYIVQTVYAGGATGDVYSYGGWAKGDSVPLNISGRAWTLCVTFHYTDGTSDGSSISFNPDCLDWQYASGMVTATKAYNYIQIFATYYDNANSVCFDGLQLYKEAFGTSYTYDSNGNLTNIGAINNAGTGNNSNTAIVYTNNNPTQVTDPAGNVTTNGFNGNHDETSTTTPNTASSTNYDAKGDNTSETTSDKTQQSARIIETDTTYTSDDNYTATTTDDSRHTTNYSYDNQLGTLQWLQDPNDSSGTHKTSYSYNSMNQTTGVSKPVDNLYNGVSQMQSAYTYNNDKIQTISHNTTSTTNNTTYTFNYNASDMENLSSIQVGSRTLVTNTYNSSDRSFDLTRATYGNSQWVQYAYDNQHRIIGIQYNNDSGNNRFSIMYNNAGNIGTLTDTVNKLFTKYIYDTGNNRHSVQETGINGRSYTHSYTWGFDSDRNVTSFLEFLNGSSWQTNYTYDGDNRLTAVNYNYGSRTGYLSWIYDGYDRISTRTVFDNGTQIFDTLNTYINPDSTHTSNLVATVENKKHSGGYDKTLTYQYDANSNITSIGDGTNTTSYVYDNANQLVRENNQAAGKTWVWVYDAGGNIREKDEYTYSTGTLGTPTSSTIYSYTDSNGWGDLLTAYNGASITYDGLGNPTNDGTWNYTWEGGRNLVSLSKTGTTASYTYNSNGIRTSKTVNGVTTTYTLVGDKVTQETDGINNIYYRYDSNNDLISMNLNGTEYYYFFDAQGDVMGLVDCNGNVVVEYTYDAWGNILSTTGSLASTVGVENPYRYKGYRYDSESGLYYLQSRYYNPFGEGLLTLMILKHCNYPKP